MEEEIGYEEIDLTKAEVSEEPRTEVKQIGEDEFWKTSERKYLSARLVEEKGIQHVKLLEYLGAYTLIFKDREGGEVRRKAVKFKVKVLDGEDKDKEYELTIYRRQAEQLSEQLTKDFKSWEGKILNVTVAGTGKFRSFVFTVYKKLE